MKFPIGGELLPLGVVSHITEELVIVQGFLRHLQWMKEQCCGLKTRLVYQW